ncbi:hypothetical protein Tco_1021061 [Tanacetum coccineum]
MEFIHPRANSRNVLILGIPSPFIIVLTLRSPLLGPGAVPTDTTLSNRTKSRNSLLSPTGIECRSPHDQLAYTSLSISTTTTPHDPELNKHTVNTAQSSTVSLNTPTMTPHKGNGRLFLVAESTNTEGGLCSGGFWFSDKAIHRVRCWSSVDSTWVRWPGDSREEDDDENDSEDESDNGDNNDDDDANDDDNQEDDDTNDDDEETDSDRTESDKIKIPVLNQSSTEYYEKEKEKFDDEEKIDDEEKMDEEEDDEVTKEMYKDVNVNLGNEDTDINNAD